MNVKETRPKKSRIMANKKEILVVGATAAAVLGGYLLKESFKEDKAEEDQKKHAGAIDSENFVDKLKDKFGASKDDEDKNVDKDSEGFVDKLKDKISGSKDDEVGDKNVNKDSESIVDKLKDKIGGSKNDEKNVEDVPPSKLK